MSMMVTIGTNPIDDQRRQEIIHYAEIEARKMIEEAESHASELLAQIENQKTDWRAGEGRFGEKSI